MTRIVILIVRENNCTCPYVYLNSGHEPVGIEWGDMCMLHGVGTEYFRNMKPMPFGMKNELKTSRGFWIMYRAPQLVTSEPVQTCKLCGRYEIVRPDGRGFPPKIAENKLRKMCKANGCECDPKYTAGFALYNKEVVEIK